ncbi:MAG TPA: isocitrate/isopropylmalate family dehydrogenase, partial [Thermoanaerobaculia bacterium]|nr:isocitrate/isopropylmalate family dehydrogenase [Thermoanaerobaculia bacterium]
FTKDNIMKVTDGLFHKVFEEVAGEYPDIEKEHWIVDIGAAKLADTPETFDVVVLPNLYGDILSDVAAQIAGSVGLAGSANIGEGFAMFEAIHGSAPRRAGQNLANPSGLLLGAVMMLVHIGQPDVAERVHNAWLTTIEDGVHTYDIFKEGTSSKKVGTREFAQAVVERLGRRPAKLKPAVYGEPPKQAAHPTARERKPAERALVGVDIYVTWRGSAEELGQRLRPLVRDGLALTTISNRGIKVWPDGFPETMQTDHWQCRFLAGDSATTTHASLAGLLTRAAEAGLDFIKTENLYNFDGQRGYSLGQGE